jgi:benzoate membrane transport protein
MAGQGAGAGDFIQPTSAGILAAVVGFASAFTIVLQGLAAAGATPIQAASGLLALCVVKGLIGIQMGLFSRLPISIAWSTPGAALLIATGVPTGGFPAAVGGFLVAAGLIVLAGLWPLFGRLVGRIPMGLASAMLAGVLFDLCLAPVRSMAALPWLTLPILLTWALMLRFARLYAVPVSVAVTAGLIAWSTPLPDLAAAWPRPELVLPMFSLEAAISIGLPLFIVTMASQNIPGLAVLRGNGYDPDTRPIFIITGMGSAVAALFGGQAMNLAAITAALCAGPEAHPDPGKRYRATVAAAATYILLGLGASYAAAFIAAAPPLLIQAVAGLALLPSLASALAGGLAKEAERLPVILTFTVAASGIGFFSIGPAFWGLVAGGALMLALRKA